MRLLTRGSHGEVDEALVERARAGDDEAFAELYRRHQAVATRTARWLLHSRHDADDAVADAFAAVLQAMRNGHGPRDDFRAYLMVCVRNSCSLRRARAMAATPTELDDDSGGVALEDPERYVEADTVARAFASLSPRWQQTLWMVDVEQRSVDEVGSQLGLRPNAVAALTYRAREGFASAYLSEHVAHAETPRCAVVGAKLGAYVRGNASSSDVALIDEHLEHCADCRQGARRTGRHERQPALAGRAGGRCCSRGVDGGGVPADDGRPGRGCRHGPRGEGRGRGAHPRPDRCARGQPTRRIGHLATESSSLPWPRSRRNRFAPPASAASRHRRCPARLRQRPHRRSRSGSAGLDHGAGRRPVRGWGDRRRRDRCRGARWCRRARRARRCATDHHAGDHACRRSRPRASASRRSPHPPSACRRSPRQPSARRRSPHPRSVSRRSPRRRSAHHR